MATDTFFSKPALTPERAAFYSRLGERSTAPLWEVLGKLVSPAPAPDTRPVLWKYDDLRPLRNFYLGDPEAVKRATEAVAGQLRKKS